MTAEVLFSRSVSSRPSGHTGTLLFSPHPSPRQSIPSFSQKQIARNRRISQLLHSTFEQIAGNSLRPVRYSTSSCNWSSSDSILVHTSACNSLRSLPFSQSVCRLPSPENILAQTSAGNSPSLLDLSKSTCKLSSPVRVVGSG